MHPSKKLVSGYSECDRVQWYFALGSDDGGRFPGHASCTSNSGAGPVRPCPGTLQALRTRVRRRWWLSRTRYKHIHVRSVAAVHGRQRSGKATTATGPLPVERKSGYAQNPDQVLENCIPKRSNVHGRQRFFTGSRSWHFETKCGSGGAGGTERGRRDRRRPWMAVDEPTWMYLRRVPPAPLRSPGASAINQ